MSSYVLMCGKRMVPWHTIRPCNTTIQYHDEGFHSYCYLFHSLVYVYETRAISPMNIPWSKQHKRDFQGAKHSLSNSFAQPLDMTELVAYYKQAVKDSTKDKTATTQTLVNEYHQHALVYTANGGSRDLKQAIADLYNHHQNQDGNTAAPVATTRMTADDILVTPGGQVAVQMAAQAVMMTKKTNDDADADADAQPHAIVFTPGYQSVVESATWFGSNVAVTQIQRTPSNDWKINVQDVRDAIRPNNQTRYLVLNEPYNPVGTLMDRATQQALIDLCREHSIVILCDEVYRLLEHDDDQHNNSKIRLPAICQAYERGISVVTMSKPWGACGVTVGWLACRDADLLDKLWNVQYFGTACLSRASEIQAIMVCRASHLILRDRLSIIRHNKALLQDVIEHRYPDLLAWTRPTAGAIAFVEFKGPLTSAALGDILAQRGISIKPAYCFVQEPVPLHLASYFRVGFGERQMPAALEAFCAVLEEYKDTWRAEMKNPPQECV